MDTVEAVVEPVKLIPPDFWYALSMVLAGVLIWMIQKYFASLQTTIKELAESISELTKIITRHDERLEQLENKNGNNRRR